MSSRIVVLDAPEIVDLIRELMDSRVVATAQEATVVDLGSEITFEEVVASQPELVMIDPRFMGGTSGWELIGRLQADARTSHLPIIVCSTGNGDDTDDHAAPSSGIQILNKPFSLQDFETALGVLDAPYPPDLRRGAGRGTSTGPTSLFHALPY